MLCVYMEKILFFLDYENVNEVIKRTNFSKRIKFGQIINWNENKKSKWIFDSNKKKIE